MRQAATSKPEVISAIRAARRRLKRTPTRSEFERMSGIHWARVQRLFGGYRVAVREAGLEPDPGGIRIDTAAMLLDFATVARKVGRHPTRDEYERLGRYASASLESRFQRWSAMRMRFLEFAEASGLEREWKDVVDRLKSGPVPRRGGGKNWLKGDCRNRATPPTSHVIGTTEEGLPRIDADPRQAGTDVRGSDTERNLAQMNADEYRPKAEGDWPQMNADQPRSETANSDSVSEVKQVRAEILLPELRGMRCVTRTILWALCAERSMHTKRSMHMVDAGLAGHGANGTDGDGRDALEPGSSHVNRLAHYGGLAHQGVTGIRRSDIEPAARDRGMAADAYIPADENDLRFWNSRFPKRVLQGRPLLGAPLMRGGLMYEPVNEMGVVFLFGMMAHRLGFWVESLQAGFPDCEAKLEVEPGRWQHVRIEFEFESRKFRDHKHDAAKCDMIVCWRHNWKGCPREMQVVELRTQIGKIAGMAKSED